VDSEHKVPLLIRDLVEHTVVGETGVVDNVVDLAKGPIFGWGGVCVCGLESLFSASYKWHPMIQLVNFQVILT
jgi:hypothetical protein